MIYFCNNKSMLCAVQVRWLNLQSRCRSQGWTSTPQHSPGVPAIVMEALVPCRIHYLVMGKQGLSSPVYQLFPPDVRGCGLLEVVICNSKCCQSGTFLEGSTMSKLLYVVSIKAQCKIYKFCIT